MSDEKVQALKTLSRFGLGLGILGGLLSIFGIYFLVIANQSLSWPSVQGSVVQTEIRRETRSKGSPGATLNTYVEYYVSVNYTYDVEGHSYFSSRYSLGEGDRVSRRYKERSDAEAEAISRFPEGTTVIVYYDPKQPTEAVLTTGWNWGTFTPLLMGVFFGGSGWLFYAVGKSANITSGQ
ncbi:DUF3592 domain-containing protein [Picosynechococcus sp. PCC 7003]|uniref:DUF3592 domain-containing protein n=1 Tax=Picosynechococcus sp. PCC 7003 TaxID=374981 RepID=UPI000B0384F7|nr:DUF3592 domain-containing protein [Picosynechococcus sp. PCC 7003]